MQLGLQFSLLLASFFVLLSGVEAAPMKRGGLVTLPLKRITQTRSDLHPQVVRPHCRLPWILTQSTFAHLRSFFSSTSTAA